MLKDLTPDEFNQLQTMLGESSEKINNATADNYQTLAFTATEYEQLKKKLAPEANVWNWMLSCLGSVQCLCYLTYPAFFIASFFITTPIQVISNKLQFDFKSLITALDTYATYGRMYEVYPHQHNAAWLDVGKAQREVPVHIANEYCRDDRSFNPTPEFNEGALRRTLTFNNYATNVTSWFPLASSPSGLGFDFGLARDDEGAQHWRTGALRGGHFGRGDLVAVRRLDEVRTADLKQSREILTAREPNDRLGFS